METIEATYRVTTPMFLGGADQQAELRLPSFKGALRFWWRASVWPRIAAQGGSVKDLHRKEAELFGSSDEKVGQSKIGLRLRTDFGSPRVIPKGTQLKDQSAVVGQGARYLGYGVMEAFGSAKKNTREGQLTRGCLEAHFSFGVSILLHVASTQKELTEAEREELLLALKLLGLLGSLGSKARKGYGSATLTRLVAGDRNLWSAPSTGEELQLVLARILKPDLGDGAGPKSPARTGEPPFTALSPQTRILVVPPKESNTSPLKLLNHLGREMIRYRSYGHNGRILGSERREEPFTFQEDHDLMKLPVAQRSSHPRRIAFGLPHNYGQGKDKEVNPAKGLDRRASSLWLHIHQASDSAPPIGVLCFMPATFLPEGNSDISVGGKRVSLNARELWKPIGGFLDRFREGKTKEPFGKVLEVNLG
jgi:CRISPR-associated protein Cmr1